MFYFYISQVKLLYQDEFVVIWMNLESVIRSEVSQKEKNKYCVLMHIYMESRKMVLMNLVSGQE